MERLTPEDLQDIFGRLPAAGLETVDDLSGGGEGFSSDRCWGRNLHLCQNQ
jgi:hypothetical protein